MRAQSDLIRLVDVVCRLHGRLTGAFADVRSQTGLSQMEQLVLASVVEAETHPTVPRIGRSLGHPRQVVQRAVNALHEKGLIELRDNPDHKRAKLLAATDAGVALQEQANALADGLAETIVANLDSADLKQAIAMLDGIRRNVDASARSDSF